MLDINVLVSPIVLVFSFWLNALANSRCKSLLPFNVFSIPFSYCASRSVIFNVFLAASLKGVYLFIISYIISLKQTIIIAHSIVIKEDRSDITDDLWCHRAREDCPLLSLAPSRAQTNSSVLIFYLNYFLG